MKVTINCFKIKKKEIDAYIIDTNVLYLGNLPETRSTMKEIIWKFALAVVFVSAFQSVNAQGNLLVAPIRVVLEDGKVREDLNLSNIGQDTSVYLVSFLHYKMLEDGSFKDLNDSDEMVTPRADTYLRIFPRRVTLPPGESQIVRLQYRKPADMKPGEYRSHLYFRAEKDVAPLGLATENRDTTQLSVNITPIFGISIPVIIRNGSLNFSVTLSNTNLTAVNDSIYNLGVDINRTGTKSAYGTLEASFIPDDGTSQFVLGMANGIGVYTELSKRNYVLQLRMREGKKLQKGKIVLRFLTPRDEGSKELTRTEFKVS
jgi:P pilus assembly chaperone PapD